MKQMTLAIEAGERTHHCRLSRRQAKRDRLHRRSFRNKDGLFDQSFVREALADSTDAAIIMAIVTLAQNLRLKVIAEGVETEEQLRLLRLLRCDEIQGYLFSRPLPADALKQLAMETPRLARGFVPALQFGTEHLGLRT